MVDYTLSLTLYLLALACIGVMVFIAYLEFGEE